ncbi:hypothetical protein CL684_02470 [Candidatus Campbellbacteria bacterium]|nr:hypothetical protein [Candidatus Campbellbacteria bacterium]|tara:strand:- start:168 stop:794 length:627 start_codon:yes stop_codon:yes gene_type:complete
MNHKQQIVHIGGGEAFNSYDQYINYLQSVPLWHMEKSQESLPWYKKYGEYLNEKKYECIKIPMPNDSNARYNEWKIWFERHIPFLRDGVILVGHSLGGIFLAKYLSHNTLLVDIEQLHLVAAPYDNENKKEQLADFKITEFPNDFYENTISRIHIYHSKDDTVVPISESEKYHKALPESQLRIFDDRFHFLDETFPELFENIRSISDE